MALTANPHERDYNKALNSHDPVQDAVPLASAPYASITLQIADQARTLQMSIFLESKDTPVYGPLSTPILYRTNRLSSQIGILDSVIHARLTYTYLYASIKANLPTPHLFSLFMVCLRWWVLAPPRFDVH